MGLLVMTNPQLGSAFCLETTTVTSSSRGAVFGFGSKKKKKSGRVFVLRKPTIHALMKESESEKKLPLVLEKELEFKPSFNEYLRAMDSVKTRRETKPKLARNFNTYNYSKVDWRENVEFNKSKQGVVRDKFNQKRSVISKSRDEKVKREPRGETSKARSLLYQRDNGIEPKLKESHFDEVINFRNASPNSPPKRSNSTTAIDRRGKLVCDQNSSKMVMFGKRGKGSFEREKVGVRSRGTPHGGSTPERNLVQMQKATTSCESDLKSGKMNTSSKSFRAKSGGDSSWEVERAAFKTLDEFNDVMDKPRVAKVEMEERIQNLARRLNGADINVPEWMFTMTMRSARIRFSDHSIMRVIQILGKLGNWRRVLQVIEWLQMRERYKSQRLRNIYTTALSVLGKARRPVEALNVFQAMQQQISSYPDLVAYHCIAVTLGQAGHINELFDLIDSLRSPPKKKFKTGVLENWDPRLEPDIVIYNAVLNACVRRKQCEGAFWVLQQLKQQGQKPSATTFGLVMEVMFACGKYSLVHEFFRKVQKSFIPNVLAYKVVVNTLWREGKTDEAVSAVEDMERQGIVGSAALYYDLARCLCSAGRCQEALMQMEKICKVANKPLVVTYTGLIQACLDSGNIQDAADIFIQMKDFCSPNLVTCNIMLKAYLEHGWFEEAKKLFQKMSEDGSRFSSGSDNNLVIPDIYTFNTMLEACSAEKRWDDLEFVYRKMLHHGYFFNAKRHLRIILDASRAGKVELLETTWKHLVQTGRTPPPPLVKERFCIRLENKDYVSALSCITNHPVGDWPEFSENAWLNLFKKNSWRFGEDTLVRLLHQASIHATRNNPPDSVLLNLLSSCKEFLRTCTSSPAMNLRDALTTVLAKSALK
ncbi:hypothetical protein LWI28_028564 [Acer negundo]|uniref:Pentatricopeptide repeat-containing protein n=1 Tax=Acer negundo TaxID=4023 RepID=A0AAD5P3E6_ACENE|nr:hypothetical protein LWI28_028564 [Acer negundo]KAK4855551.1 hypothetical protein QYF36_008441 [Acer negundo]